MMGRPRTISPEWMVTWTPQEEWIEGKGKFLWLAFFFSEIGAGIYFVSLFMNFPAGWLVGWLVSLVLGGLTHTAYLGKPFRGWRILLQPGSSELSRGLWVILFYGVIGFFQVIPIIIPSLPWTGDSAAFKTIMGIICILMITHGFLTMSVVRALPLWNSSMMIPLSLASGICVGSQAVEWMMFFTGRDAGVVELWARWSLLGYMGMLVIFLWSSFHSSDAARESARRLLGGDSSALLYVGVVAVGLLIPLVVTLYIWGGGVGKIGGGIVLLRFICVFIGDLVMRYEIMKGGLYTPLL